MRMMIENESEKTHRIISHRKKKVPSEIEQQLDGNFYSFQQ